MLDTGLKAILKCLQQNCFDVGANDEGTEKADFMTQVDADRPTQSHSTDMPAYRCSCVYMHGSGMNGAARIEWT